MHTSEKGVNPYGQPDRKISGFFFDDFPNQFIQNLSNETTLDIDGRPGKGLCATPLSLCFWSMRKAATRI